MTPIFGVSVFSSGKRIVTFSFLKLNMVFTFTQFLQLLNRTHMQNFLQSYSNLMDLGIFTLQLS